MEAPRGIVRPHPFDIATSVRPVAPHRWRGPADPEWFGGGAPHGGHLAAQLLRAAQLEAADPALRPRSLTVHFASRADPGELEVETRLERQGRTLSTLSARATQSGRVVALAMAALASHRPGPRYRDPDMPDLAPPEELPGPPPRSRTSGTRVGDHYERRFAIGRPLSGDPARAGGWIRPREPREPDHLLTTALADMWMPAVLTRLRERIGTSTVELTVNYLDTTE
ncbi:MAG TPA: thioesterase family protein, partial [Candidatus Eisenbacteria bacterium]|nr:thioesterase family protein [Candidatus Eisenbacteria bacterium]